MLIDLLVQVFFVVIFIANIPYDFLYQVFDCYQPGHRAIFIYENHHVHALLANFAQQVIQLFGLRHKVGRAHKAAYRQGIMTIAQLFQHVLCIEQADNVFNAIFIDRDTRKANLHGQVYRLVNSRVASQRHHVYTRHHHLAHRPIRKLEDAVNHLRFFLFEYAFFLANRDQQAQFFLCHKGAAMLHLPAHQPYQGVRNRAQRYHNGTQQPCHAAHYVHQSACPAQGILHSGSFRSDLTEDQDDQ